MELVDHVAVAVAVGVGFDVILWYFIWLCWFDCARSSILPDVSRYPSKAFCFIGLLVASPEFQWLFDGINAPFECRPRSWGRGGGHVERACMESESQMSEESVEGKNFLKMQILHWSGISNVQISFRDFGVWLKKGAFLFQMAPNPLHIFQKGFCQAYASLRKKARHLHLQMKWMANRCEAHLWWNCNNCHSFHSLM